MHRRIIGFAVVAMSLSLLVLAVVMVAGAAPNRFTDPPNLGARYVGSRRCDTCHNTAEATLWDAWHATLHAQTVRPASSEAVVGDLSDSESLTITWPDGTERPITLEDIDLVIGGRYIQQYVTVLEGEDGEPAYYLLPVAWNIPQTATQVGVWTPYHPEDWATPERDWRMICAGCHTTGLTQEKLEAGARFMPAEDALIIDVELGVGCEACHGPGGDHNGGANPMPSTPDAQVCGQCHARGQATGGDHPFPLGYQPGLPLEEWLDLADAGDEATWWPTGHARALNSQYNEWLSSAHSTALTTLQASDREEDGCLRCHSTPPDTTDPTPDAASLILGEARYGITCALCHNPHPAESAPRGPYDLDTGVAALGDDPFHAGGALLRLAPPDGRGGAWQGEPEPLPYLLETDPYTLCTSCHNSATPEGELMLVGGALHYPVQEMFEGRTVVAEVAGVPSPHFTEPDGPRCVTCHMVGTASVGEYGRIASHLLTAILPGTAGASQPDSCTACHTEATTPEQLQQMIDDTQAIFQERLQAVHQALPLGPEIEPWVPLALSLVERDGSLGLHNPVYADALLTAVEVELGLAAAMEPSPSMEARVAELRDELAPPARPLPEVLAERLTEPGRAILAAGGVLVLVALVGFVALRRRRALALLPLVLGIVLGVVAFALPQERIEATGEDSYCLVCHGQDGQTFALPDGSQLNLAIPPDAVAGSVHGPQSETGQLGCLDCHDMTAYPHQGPPPASRRAYRLEMSSICIECHTHQLEHYIEVLERNIPVGCADCHGAHDVQPASTLPRGIIPPIRPQPEQTATPAR